MQQLHTTKGNRRARHDRAATLVEYALGVALIMVVSIGAINFLEDSSGDALTERGASVGTPDLDESASTTVPDGSGGGGSSGGGGTPSAVTVTSSVSSSSVNHQGNNWDPQVVISVTDATSSSTSIDNATISGTWTVQPANTSTVVSCTTEADGVCTFQLRNLEARSNKSDYVSTVTFTVTSISSTEQSLTYAPSSPLTVTINLT